MQDAPVEAGISKTAIWVAAARAIGAREPDPAARNPDSLAALLLGDPSRLVLRHPMVDALHLGYEEAMRDPEVADTVRAMTERSRFIDEALERAIGGGVTQVLIPGSGLDTHAWRHRDLLAGVRVFEVDRPATLTFKQQRALEALGGVPDNLTFVSLDLQREDLAEALASHGYDPAQRTFVILEGVTMYVPQESLRALLRFIAAHPAGSSVVFDFATEAMITGLAGINVSVLPPAVRASLDRFFEMLRDEPWVTGIRADSEAQYLAEVGLRLQELLVIGSEESAARYLTRADGSTVGAEAHAKSEAMRKAALARAAEKMTPEQFQKREQWMREQARQTTYRIAEASVP